MSNKLDLNELKNRAKSNDYDAQYEYAKILKDGKLQQKNLEGYLKWMTTAAKGKQSDACYELADCYFNGFATNKNDEMGIHWLKEAIQLKNTNAYAKMGIILISRLNSDEKKITEDLKQAEQLLRAAANKGNLTAQFNLAMLYKTGIQGLSSDESEALRWLLKAGENGNADAQNQLGYIYISGNKQSKVKPNEEEALKWWKKSAETGHMEAQYNVATVYARMAKRYWKIASEKGDEKSSYMLKQMKNLD